MIPHEQVHIHADFYQYGMRSRSSERQLIPVVLRTLPFDKFDAVQAPVFNEGQQLVGAVHGNLAVFGPAATHDHQDMPASLGLQRKLPACVLNARGQACHGYHWHASSAKWMVRVSKVGSHD